MSFGIIASSGGAVFATAVELLRSIGENPHAIVITDRKCGIESKCEQLGIEHIRIEDSTREGFSEKAARVLYRQVKVDWSCLFFLRLVTRAIFAPMPCINIHPSLLPAYKGFRAIQRLISDKGKFLGATAHLVNDSIDGGPIIAQVTAPICISWSLEKIERLSFVQKLYVFLVVWECAKLGVLNRDKLTVHSNILPWASPCLVNSDLSKAFEQFLTQQGIEWIR